MACGRSSPRLPKDNAIIHHLPGLHPCKGDGLLEMQFPQAVSGVDNRPWRRRHRLATAKYPNVPIRYLHCHPQDLLSGPQETTVANGALRDGSSRVLPRRWDGDRTGTSYRSSEDEPHAGLEDV